VSHRVITLKAFGRGAVSWNLFAADTNPIRIDDLRDPSTAARVRSVHSAWLGSATVKEELALLLRKPNLLIDPVLGSRHVAQNLRA
jgi:hypothetical protein